VKPEALRRILEQVHAHIIREVLRGVRWVQEEVLAGLAGLEVVVDFRPTLDNPVHAISLASARFFCHADRANEGQGF